MGLSCPIKHIQLLYLTAGEKIVHLKRLGRKMKFLKQITKPVIQTLDILQGAKNVFYGTVMPSSFLLQKKLQSLSEMKWKYCEPIIQCLQNSLESRLNTYLNVKSSESKEAIIAALSHPFF